jgi:hypothetical protein
MPGTARGACSAMPAYAQALTLAPREMLQKVGNSARSDLGVSNKETNAFFAPPLVGDSEDGLGCCSADFASGEARHSHPGLMLFDQESCSRPDSESVLKRFLSDSEALSLVLPSNPPLGTSGATPGIVANSVPCSLE